MQKRPIRLNRLSVFTSNCQFNPRLRCRGQSPKSFHCPLQDDQFTDLLDFYFMGGKREDPLPGIIIPRDVQAIPQLQCKQIAVWFDSDFHALEQYCTWKCAISGAWETEGDVLRRTLGMTYRLCNEFRRAWCRYYVQTQPLEVQKPRWMRGWEQWRGSSVARAQAHGVEA
jgi:hypothetical protein